MSPEDAGQTAASGAGNENPVTPRDATYLRTHTLEAELLAFMLDHEGNLITQQARESTSGRTAKTIVKEGPLRVTVVGLRNGVTLEEHRTEAPVLIQVLAGLIHVTTSGGNVSVARGGMIALNSGVSHTVQAETDTALLLTIAGEMR